VLFSHYPQLKGTTVASTPEQERLRQLSMLNSMVWWMQWPILSVSGIAPQGRGNIHVGTCTPIKAEKFLYVQTD